MAAIFARMPANVLVATIGALRASALGAYGNTTFPTPNLDQFAASSLLFDSCYAASLELSEIYGSLWHGTSKANESSILLPNLFAEHQYATTLVTDDADLQSFVPLDAFQNIEISESAARIGSTLEKADDTADTSVGRLLYAVVERIHTQSRSSTAPQFVWLHARGMYGPWDAPLDLQEALRDETDPPAIEAVAPPDIRINLAKDPDAI